MTSTNRAVRAAWGLLIAAVMLAAPRADAAFLQLTPAASTVEEGATFALALGIGGLAVDPRQLVGGLTLDLRFDPGRVSFVAAEFALREFGDVDPADPFDDPLVDAATADGVLSLFALSLLTGSDALAAAQTGGAFRVATLIFRAIGSGADGAVFGFGATSAVDFDGARLEIAGPERAAVVSIVAGDGAHAVPEPGPLGLFGAVLLAGVAWRRLRARFEPGLPTAGIGARLR